MLRGLALIGLAAITWGTTGAVTTLLVAVGARFLLGALLALVAGFAYALYVVIAKASLRGAPALPLTASTFATAAVLSAPLLAWTDSAWRCYGLRKAPSPARMLAIAEAWRPYRTVACEYLWKSLEAAPV